MCADPNTQIQPACRVEEEGWGWKLPSDQREGDFAAEVAAGGG